MKLTVLFCAGILLLPMRPSFAQEKLYTPEGRLRPSTDRVEIEGLRLLAAQEVFERNVAVQSLADLAKDVQRCISESVPANVPGFGLLVRITLASANKPKYEMSSDGKAGDDLLQTIYDRLQKLPDVSTKTDDVSFEIHFRIKPKS